MKPLDVHPFADLVPPMGADEFTDLVADMKANGFDERFPIYVIGNQIIDGRHRYKAAVEAGVTPKVVAWGLVSGQDDLASFVLRAARRRNLTTAQRATMAAEFEPHLREEAEKRMKSGKSDPVGKLPTGSRDHSKTTRVQAAKSAGVSDKTARVAIKAKAEDPEVFEKMKNDEITVAQADREMRAKSEPPKREPKLDKLGRPIHPKAAKAIAAIPEFARFIRELHAWKRSMLAALPEDGPGRLLNHQSIQKWVDQLATHIRHASPHTSCPMHPKCPPTCGPCKGTQWVTEDQWSHIPEDQR